MNERRTFPTLLLLAGVGGALALACHGFGPVRRATGVWPALLAPPAARADDGLSTGIARDTAAPEVVLNPFAMAPPSDVAPEQSAASQVVAQRESAPATGRNERYASAPTLEPIRPRRVNPQLADEDDAPVTQSLQREPAQQALVETKAPRAAIRDRYAERRYVVPVTHNDPLPEQGAKVPAASADADDSAPDDAAGPTASKLSAEGRAAEPRHLAAAAQPVESDGCERHGGGSVRTHWIMPATATVGQEVTCQLVVRNAGETVAQDVVVVAQFPAGVDPGLTEPAAAGEGRNVAWRLGDMSPGASLTRQLTFTPREQGDLTPRAAVTFTHELAATIRIVEPKLAITVEGPPETVAGQPSTYHFRVTNEGTGAATDVSIDVHLADGLEAANGSKSYYNVGTLGPGQSRHVQMMICAAAPGEFAVHGRALAGDAELAKVAHTIRVVQPTLALAIEGPKLRFVDRRAEYTIKVQNPGPAAIDNVQLLESVPDGFRFAEASSGGSFDRNVRQVAWFVGRLEANETATVGVRLIATEAGDHRLNAAAKADYGVIGEAETTTRVKGAPRIAIDVTEDDDPVEVDGETVYRVRLSNLGSTPARRVQFAADVPREMQIIDVNGPGQGTVKGQQLVFPPIDVLEAGQNVAYDVHVKCLKPGQVRFRAYFRSEDTPSAVLEEEATRIYAD